MELAVLDLLAITVVDTIVVVIYDRLAAEIFCLCGFVDALYIPSVRFLIENLFDFGIVVEGHRSLRCAQDFLNIQWVDACETDGIGAMFHKIIMAYTIGPGVASGCKGTALRPFSKLARFSFAHTKCHNR